MSYGHRGLIIRLGYLGVAAGWWVAHGMGRWGRRGAVALCYHGVRAEQTDRFAWQMARVSDRSVWPSEMWMTRPDRRRPVCVTSDDGFANLLAHALPACARHGVRLTVFAVTENTGTEPRWEMPRGHPERTERLMTPEQMLDASRTGVVRWGSHTKTHPRLTALGSAALWEELSGSREALGLLLGEAPDDLALPHGAWSADVLRAARSAGYARVFTLEHEFVDERSLRTGSCGRFSVSPDMWRLEFLLTLSGGYAWLGWWRRLVSRARTRGVASRMNGAPA